MNKEFEYWLSQKIFGTCSGGWIIIDPPYDNIWNWNWNDLKEWDE